MSIRVLTAVIIGYGLTVLYTVAISKTLMILGLTKVNATVSMQLLSFLIYSIVVMWVFSVASLRKLWLHITYSMIISLVLIYLINMGLQ